jgi:hypothetical protein
VRDAGLDPADYYQVVEDHGELICDDDIGEFTQTFTAEKWLAEDPTGIYDDGAQYGAAQYA